MTIPLITRLEGSTFDGCFTAGSLMAIALTKADAILSLIQSERGGA